MNLRNMGDKDGTKSLTWWGVVILGLDGVLALAMQNFGGNISPEWLTVLQHVAGLIGGVMTILGLRRAVGRIK